jgi:hypothetical protein
MGEEVDWGDLNTQQPGKISRKTHPFFVLLCWVFVFNNDIKKKESYYLFKLF